MELYLAGVNCYIFPPGMKKVKEQSDLNNLKYILESYFYLRPETIKRYRQENYSLFLDSGAYTAFNKGLTIDIQEYIEFVKEYQHIFPKYAALDVIGDAEKTYKNVLNMRKAGLNPISAYHLSSPYSELQKLIDLDVPIALGGIVSNRLASKPKILLNYLDTIFNKFLIPNKCYVHGFGVTSIKLIRHYPWDSVDSSNWVSLTMHGKIEIYLNGKNHIYDCADKSTKTHILNLSPVEKYNVSCYIRNTFNMSLEDLKDYKNRAIINIYYYINLLKNITIIKNRSYQSQLF